MRYMMIVKGDRDFEAGIPPDPRLMEAMGKLSAEMIAKGVMLEQGGLRPSANGARLNVAGGALIVTDGPFSESKELIGGYAILEAASKADAIEIGRRFMRLNVEVLGPGFDGEVEIREMYPAGPCGTRA